MAFEQGRGDDGYSIWSLEYAIERIEADELL
jgi:hypothetical protein